MRRDGEVPADPGRQDRGLCPSAGRYPRVGGHGPVIRRRREPERRLPHHRAVTFDGVGHLQPAAPGQLADAMGQWWPTT